MSKNTPFTRMCIACRERNLAGEMKRVELDNIGRSCYVCGNCIDIVVKKKLLNKAFRMQVPDSVYEGL